MDITGNRDYQVISGVGRWTSIDREYPDYVNVLGYGKAKYALRVTKSRVIPGKWNSLIVRSEEGVAPASLTNYHDTFAAACSWTECQGIAEVDDMIFGGEKVAVVEDALDDAAKQLLTVFEAGDINEDFIPNEGLVDAAMALKIQEDGHNPRRWAAVLKRAFPDARTGKKAVEKKGCPTQVVRGLYGVRRIKCGDAIDHYWYESSDEFLGVCVRCGALRSGVMTIHRPQDLHRAEFRADPDNGC